MRTALAVLGAVLLAACGGGGGGGSGGTSAPPPAPPATGSNLAVETPASDTLGPFGSHEYKLDTVVGTQYLVTVSQGQNEVDLFPSFDGATAATCDSSSGMIFAAGPQDCILTATGTLLHVMVSSATGGPYTALVTKNIGPTGATSSESSVALTLGPPHAGFVASSPASTYVITGLSGPVDVVLSGVHVSSATTTTASLAQKSGNRRTPQASLVSFGGGGGAKLVVSSASDFSSSLACDSGTLTPSLTTPQGCTLFHPPSTLYVQVTSINNPCDCQSPPPPSTIGYTLTVSNRSQTFGAPVTLSLSTPTMGLVQAGQTNVYQVTGLSNTTPYVASLYGIAAGAVGLQISTDNTSPASPCGSLSNVGSSPVDCVVPAGPTTLYLWVTGAPAAPYIVQVDPQPAANSGNTDVGCSDCQFDLTKSPSTSGTVSDGSSTNGVSYYSVSGLSSSTPVTVSLRAINGATGADPDLSLLKNGSIVGSNGTLIPCDAGGNAIGTAAEECILLAPPSPLYINVTTKDDGQGFGKVNSSYVLTVTPLNTTLPTLPTVTPIPLTLNLPLSGTVPYGGYALYQISGLTPGVSYTASMTGVSADLSLWGFAGVGCTNWDNTFAAGTVPEDCSSSIPVDTAVVAVAGYAEGGAGGLSGSFEVGVAPLEPFTGATGGSIGSPSTLTLGTATQAAVSGDGSAHYYQISGLTGATLVSVTGINPASESTSTDPDVNLRIFTNSDFTSGELTSGCPHTGFVLAQPEDCLLDASTVAGAGGTLYIQVDNPTGSPTSQNSGYSIVVTPAP